MKRVTTFTSERCTEDEWFLFSFEGYTVTVPGTDGSFIASLPASTWFLENDRISAKLSAQPHKF